MNQKTPTAELSLMPGEHCPPLTCSGCAHMVGDFDGCGHPKSSVPKAWILTHWPQGFDRPKLDAPPCPGRVSKEPA